MAILIVAVFPSRLTRYTQKIGDMYNNLFTTALLPVTEAMPKLKVVS